MKKQNVIEHFKTATAVADALNISRQAVSDWPDIIPEGAAYKLQVITAGLLRVDPAVYAKKKAAQA